MSEQFTLPELSDGRSDELHGEADQVVFGSLAVELLWFLHKNKQLFSDSHTGRWTRDAGTQGGVLRCHARQSGCISQLAETCSSTKQSLPTESAGPQTRKKVHPNLSGSVYEQTGVAVDAPPPAQVVVVTAVHRSDPDHSVHLLSKLPPLTHRHMLFYNSVG